METSRYEFKDIEKRVHSALHENLTLLSAFYPPTKEFKLVFKKDMFTRNNRAGFFEVIYYLLNTLNPELTAEKLLSWPIRELKSEPKFRAEVVAYVNVLNSLYENANIPTCQPSSLISPGGYRFAKFMLKISQLVVYEHLKKTCISLHSHIKPHKNINLGTDKELNKVTKAIEKETNNLMENFNKYHAECVNKSTELIERMEKLNREIQKSRETLEDIRADLNEQYPITMSINTVKEKIIELKRQINEVQEMNNLFVSGEQLMKYLSDPSMNVEHQEEKFNVPEDVAHIITNTENLNLCEFFEALKVFLETKALQLQSPTDCCMQQTKEALEIYSMRNQETLNQLEVQQAKIRNIQNKLRALIL
ncbi:unnamed protein product [Ceutorhynchus assimilis]|uniref:HAUS augmin-like complex subunit 6 N-terminal domain-containing protein n=1 Tax=Ceutorhynchus assimilis TaxID=467358 RepID=A0A9N9MVJ0_9CUCU|nr:unnamed protein product [Ceutorhynchus assimilis]